MALPVDQKPPATSGPGRLLGGVASFNCDGNYYDAVSDLEWSPSSFRRETMPGLNGIHGYSEKYVAGFISITLRDTFGTSVASFNTLRSVTVIVQLANGKNVTVTHGWCVEVQEVHSDEGTFKVRFESDQVVEGASGNPELVGGLLNTAVGSSLL